MLVRRVCGVNKFCDAFSRSSTDRSPEGHLGLKDRSVRSQVDVLDGKIGLKGCWEVVLDRKIGVEVTSD
jgi:hypothetical protein